MHRILPMHSGHDDAAPLELARSKLCQATKLLVSPGEPVENALKVFNEALELAPCLKPYMYHRGFALYYLGRFSQASDQFKSSCTVDCNDVEPWLWRTMSEAKVNGWRAATEGLKDFQGYDRRLCMMQVLDLCKGNCSVDEVLQCANGDIHATARATFACALYYEARGEEITALPLLSALTAVEKNPLEGDIYALAACHLRGLRHRLAIEAGISRIVTHNPFTEISGRRFRGLVTAPLSNSC